jgi:hypothetical protein
MALVRITEKLKHDIRRNVVEMFVEEHTKARETEDFPDKDKWGDRIYELAHGAERIATMAKLPITYFGFRTTFDVDGINWYDGGSKHLRSTISFEFSQPRPDVWPDVDYAGFVTANGRDILLNGRDPRWGEFTTVYKAWVDRMEAVTTKENTFREGVTTVLNQFQTLSPALKAWPPLWELVPNWAKDKHREITKRAAPAAPVVRGVDISQMTAIATAHKLTKGSR